MAYDDPDRWPGMRSDRSAEHLIAEAQRLADDIRRRAERDAAVIRRDAAEWAARTRAEAERHRAPAGSDPVVPTPVPAPPPPPAGDDEPVGDDRGRPRRRLLVAGAVVVLVAALALATLSSARSSVSDASVPAGSALAPLFWAVGERSIGAAADPVVAVVGAIADRPAPSPTTVPPTTAPPTTVPTAVAMPDVTGMSLDGAIAALHTLGLRVADVCCHSHGPVTHQHPPPGTSLAPGSTVELRRGP